MDEQISQCNYLTSCSLIDWAPVETTLGKPSSILKRGLSHRQEITSFQFISLSRIPETIQILEIYHKEKEPVKRIDKQIFRHECKTKLHYLVPLEMVTKELVGFKREGETLYGVHICQESDAGLGEYGNNWVNFVEQWSKHENKLIFKMVISYEKNEGYVLGNLRQGFINKRIADVIKVIQALSSNPLPSSGTLSNPKNPVSPVTHFETPIKTTSTILDDPSFNQQHLRFPKLSKQQRQTFQQMQERFPTVSDNDLCRFLIAANFKLEEATKKYQKHLEWRESAVSRYTMDSFKEITDKRMFLYCGKDKKGRVVVFNEAAKVIPSELNQDLYCEFYNYYFAEYIPTKMTGYADQLIILANGKDLGLRNFKISLTKKNMNGLLENCPEREACLIAVNANWFGTTVWSILRPLLPEKSAKKIEVYGSNKEQNLKRLLELMDIEVIPVSLGGNNRLLNNY